MTFSCLTIDNGVVQEFLTLLTCASKRESIEDEIIFVDFGKGFDHRIKTLAKFMEFTLIEHVVSLQHIQLH